MLFSHIILLKKIEKAEKDMKTRKKPYGSANVVGKNVERLRKMQHISQKSFVAMLQVQGCDVNPTSYSKLEGQIRVVTDKELFFIAKALGLPMEALFPDDFDRAPTDD